MRAPQHQHNDLARQGSRSANVGRKLTVVEIEHRRVGFCKNTRKILFEKIEKKLKSGKYKKLKFSLGF